MNLALKYRPREFSQIVGQRATSVVLQAMIAKQALSQVLLFTGPSGVGKTSMARIIAAQLNSEAAESVHEGRHPSVIEIDAASNGSVEAIRALKKSTAFASVGNRVVIIDEAHSMSDEAKTALLNLLEFPPANVTFILITTESHRIPKTIRHRCDRYEFNKANFQDLRNFLGYVDNEEQFTITSGLLDLIAQRSEGSYREALMILEQVTKAGIVTAEEYNELQGEVDFGPTLVSSTLDGPVAAINQLENILRYTNTEEISDRTVETLRDLMLLKGGIAIEYTGEALEARVNIAKRVELGNLLKAIRILWDLQTKLGTADPVRGLEMAFSLIGEVLQDKTSIPSPVITAPTTVSKPRAMSLEQMQSYRG